MSVFGIKIEESQVCLLKNRPSKRDALEALINAVARNPVISDRDAFQRAVFEREAVNSTGIGGGVAIPHVRLEGVAAPTVGVAVAPEGVDYDTLDNKPVYLMVLFATPKGADKEYLSLLAQVMQALRDQELLERLITCKTAAEVYQTISL